MKISFEEIVNFIYFNLESLLHIVLFGLLVTIGPRVLLLVLSATCSC